MAIVTADNELKLVSTVMLMCSKKVERKSCQMSKISANSRP
jgi:hypothetical protein